jgi:uroporphyrinogen-III decarboxylase
MANRSRHRLASELTIGVGNVLLTHITLHRFQAKLLPMAVEAGFAGIHGLEPWSMALAAIKAECGDKLILMGNADVRTLCGSDIASVRQEVRRGITEGGPNGFMLSSCNSIFPGMHPAAVREFFRVQAELIEGRIQSIKSNASIRLSAV